MTHLSIRPVQRVVCGILPKDIARIVAEYGRDSDMDIAKNIDWVSQSPMFAAIPMHRHNMSIMENMSFEIKPLAINWAGQFTHQIHFVDGANRSRGDWEILPDVLHMDICTMTTHPLRKHLFMPFIILMHGHLKDVAEGIYLA
jgi:hypothetical protein